MTTQVTFDKPNGFITVTDGSRTWIISKEEAKSVFVTTAETKTISEEMGSLFAAFITLIPLERRKKTKYEVKIVTESGEEVVLFSGRNVNLAYDMVKRLADFTKRGINEEIYFEEPVASARIVKKKKSLKVAGIFEIISSPFVFVSLTYTYYGLSYEGWYD